jgi:hypothetical protein
MLLVINQHDTDLAVVDRPSFPDLPHVTQEDIVACQDVVNGLVALGKMQKGYYDILLVTEVGSDLYREVDGVTEIV